MDAKRLLRTRLISERNDRSSGEREAAGMGIAAAGVAAWAGSRCVAAYAGCGNEPPTRPLLDALRGRGVIVLLPVIAEHELRWAPYDGWEGLVAGPLGIPQPQRADPRQSLADADIVVVPALAVDRHGWRLGRGAGYYDRALAALPPERIVAVVFADELLDDVPHEPHDVPVGAVLTPTGLVLLAPAPD